MAHSSQNLFTLSGLAALFLPFCVDTKFSFETNVIVFHLEQLKAPHASPGNTEGDGKTGRGTDRSQDREPRIRGQSTMMPHSAALGVKSISQFIISLHTFKLR